MNDSLCVCLVDDQSDEILPVQIGLDRLGIESRWFPTAEALLESDALHRAGCLVVDLGLPGMSGLGLQSELRKRRKLVPTIVVSGQATVPEAIRAFESGACAFFEKPFGMEQLLTAISGVLAIERDRKHREQERSNRLQQLSQREIQVLEQLVAGRNVKSIGRELGISPSTAEKHRASVLLKTGFESVIELTRYMMTNASTQLSLENFASRRFDEPAVAAPPSRRLHHKRRAACAR